MWITYTSCGLTFNIFMISGKGIYRPYLVWIIIVSLLIYVLLFQKIPQTISFSVLTHISAPFPSKAKNSPVTSEHMIRTEERHKVALLRSITESDLDVGDKYLNLSCPKQWEALSKYKLNLEILDYHQLNILHSDVDKGGYWKPSNCEATDSLAVVVPFRDRSSHLRILLHNLHGFLKSQLLEYQIFVVEQVGNQTFNRGKLMNVGYAEANAISNHLFSCFVFHDVDLIPEANGPFYACDDEPKVLAWYQSQFDYKPPYAGYMGGVVSIRPDQWIEINGFSNDYWGWGGEDDDVAERVRLHGYYQHMPKEPLGRFYMIEHKKFEGQEVNKCRYSLLNQVKRRWKSDGLSNLDYKKLNEQKFHLYTWVLVDLNENDAKLRLQDEGVCSWWSRLWFNWW